jgi:hypothetical protein
MAQIQSGNSTALATVGTTNTAIRSELFDANGNSVIVKDKDNAVGIKYGVMMAGSSDNTSRVLRTDRIGSLRIGADTLLFRDDIEGTTLNSQLWVVTASTFTISQAAQVGININNSNGVAVNSYSLITSQRQFPKMQATPLRCRFRARLVPQTNAIAEMGFCLPVTTTAQIATGAYFRMTSSGAIVPVLSFNNSDVVQGTDVSALLSSANYYTYGIWVDDDNVLFTVQDVSTGKIVNEQALQIPITQAKVWSATHLPFSARLMILGSAAPAAPQLILSDVYVSSLDAMTYKPQCEQMAGLGLGAEVAPTTYIQSANMANSTTPANATLSNTAAGYATLGGLFSFAAVAGAVTDYALFAFTVPVGYTFNCTGIDITTYNTGAAGATTPTLLQWAVASNSSAVSLATTTLNRVALGAQSLPVGIAIGGNVPDMSRKFTTPLVTNGGRMFHVILRMPVGTATASQVIQGAVNINGYFE